mgnify:CR=1 FL=1
MKPSRYGEEYTTPPWVVTKRSSGGNGEGPVRADVGVARHGELAEEARALCMSERRRSYDVAGEENELIVAEGEELAKHAQGDEREEDGSVLR